MPVMACLTSTIEPRWHMYTLASMSPAAASSLGNEPKQALVTHVHGVSNGFDKN